MIELHLDLKFQMKPWKKALLFSFLFYLIILFIFIIIITFALRDFKFGLVSIISAIYLGALTLGFRHMYRRFQEKFTVLNKDKSER
jgi:positive regulator of sigma E activity